jgi:hypothetical protein
MGKEGAAEHADSRAFPGRLRLGDERRARGEAERGRAAAGPGLSSGSR